MTRPESLGLAELLQNQSLVLRWPVWFASALPEVKLQPGSFRAAGNLCRPPGLSFLTLLYALLGSEGLSGFLC